MFTWVKEFFSTKTPGSSGSMLPVTHKATKEYVYMGDGMMEEVITRSPVTLYPAAASRTTPKATSKSRNISSTSSSVAMTAPIVTAHSYDSGSSYDSSSCDSGGSSGGCD